jgi:predicted RNase H-like HicB family nuclease
MKSMRFVFWVDGGYYIGYFDDYPDYWTQGYSFDELKENLKDLYIDLISEEVPYIKKVDELVVA